MLNGEIKAVADVLDGALTILRGLRESRQNDLGKRELSEAITCIETGSMWMNRSMFTADEPDYHPNGVFKREAK